MAYGSFGFSYNVTPWVKRLLIANVAVFLVMWLASAVIRLDSWLAFTPSGVLFRPWTILTYMFVHAGFWHMFFNMLMLFFFGPPIEERWGSREFIKYYLLCGLGAALLGFVFAFHSPVVGASGAIYGVMVAFAMLWPNAPIYIWGIFPVPAKWLVIALVFFSFMMTFSSGGDGVAHFAHLGGALAGFIYLRLGDRVGYRITAMKKAVTRPKLRVVQGEAAKAPVAAAKAKPRRNTDEERMLDEVDRVLDKISASGMGSLTPDERKLLDEVSRRYRKD